MYDARGKAAFYTSVIAGEEARWQVAKGVTFVCRRDYLTWGIALKIESAVLRPKQLTEALMRRFEQAHIYHGYFLFVDPHRDFVVWHAVGPDDTHTRMLDDIRQHQLLLAGLEHLYECAAVC